MASARASTVVATLLRRLSRRALVLLAVLTTLVAAGRGLIIAAAVVAAAGETRMAVALGVGAAAVLLVDRLVSTTVRITVETDLHRMVARVLLEGDVLAVPQSDVSRTVYEGAEHALGLVTRSAVVTVADGLVVAVSLPFLADVLPGRAPIFALLSLVLASFGLLAVRRTTRRLEELARAAHDKASDLTLAAVEGRLEIVACGGEERLLQRLEESLHAYEVAARRAAYGGAILGRVPLVAGAALFVALCVADPAVRATFGATALENAIVFVACLPAFAGFVLSAHAATRAAAQAAAFVDLLAAPPRREVSSPGGVVPPLPSELAARRVSFAYADDAVLDGVSFAARPGDPIILTGRNGSGKSTLLRLLLGLRPPKTGVLELGGTPLATVDLTTYRRSVAYLPQRAYLGESHAAVRWALKLTSPDATDEEMVRALRKARLPDTLGGAALLDKRIGELSAGQRQRVALARVLLSDARFVLLDEPDANLDRDGVTMIATLVTELAREEKMVAVAAHTPELAELQGCHVELAERSE